MVSKALVVLLVGGAAVAGAVVLSRKTTAAGPPPPPTPRLTSLVLAATPPTSVVAGGSVSFLVSPLDQTGSPMSGVAGQMAEGGVPVAGTWTSGPTGVVTVSLQFPTAGTFQVTAISGGVTSNSVTVTVSGPSGPPPPPPPPPPPTSQLTSLVLAATTPTSVAAGGNASFSITAKDQTGSSMSGVAGQITEGGVPVPGATFTTGAGGVATVTLQFAAAGSFQVGALSGGVLSNTVVVTVSAPPPPPPPPPPSASFTVQSASANSTGATSSIQSNLVASSGPKVIHYDVLSLSGAPIASATSQRGWNPGEIIVQPVTWTAPLATGSYTLKVYVTDIGGVTAISNVLSVPFTV